MEQIIAQAPDQETREALGVLNYESAMAVLNKFFTRDDKNGTILGSMCASAIDGTHKGPYTKGGAMSLAYHYCAGDNYDFKIPKGGIGSLSFALEKVALKYGTEIRYKSPITNFVIEDGKVTGVDLKDGNSITADAIISTLDAQSTFIRLAGREHLPLDFVSDVEEIEYTNGYIQIHLCLDDLPTFINQLEFVNGTDQSWIVAYIKSPEHLQQAWLEFKQGKVPEDPAVYCYFPSVMDPSLAPEGKHTCTLFSHYFPAHNPKGEHKQMKLEMEKRMIDAIERVAPDLRKLITNKAVFTQHYFEKNFGATAGDFAQGLIHPGQMFGDRSVPNFANFGTPLENLFIAGGGSHPGPGVTCLPGMYGAKVVLQTLNEKSQDRQVA